MVFILHRGWCQGGLKSLSYLRNGSTRVTLIANRQFIIFLTECLVTTPFFFHRVKPCIV